MKNIFVLLMLMGSFSSLLGQVGINTNNPHASSLLDMTATDKGLLIPRMNSGKRDALNSIPPVESLLVYDTDLKGFCFFIPGNPSPGTWYSLNEWEKTDANNNVLLNGNATINGSLATQTISNSGGITTNTMTGTTSIASGNINNSGSLTNSGAITTGSLSSSGAISGSSLNINGFSNNALTPAGVIVMWTGASPPSGWALCDGTNGTPDLRTRFIAASGGSLQISGFGTPIFIAASQLPPHDHVMHGSGGIPGSGGPFYLSRSNGAYSGGGGDSFGRSTGPDSDLRTSAEGQNAPIDNRPPYYALTFIMKK